MVTRSQSYTGDTPWSLQHLGCGHQGTWVSLTQAYILTARHRGLDSSAVWLMREWIKFKFGVFEELRGFAGDDLYSDTYSVGEDIRRTYGCSEDSEAEEDNMFCDEGQTLNMLAPTKQNLLCAGRTARDVIKYVSVFL